MCELDEDRNLLRLNWCVERVGWTCVALVVIAAFTGVFGRGPLSDRRVEQGSLHAEYDAVMRRSAPGTITIHVDGDSGSSNGSWRTDSTVSLWASRTLLHGCSPQSIRPQPTRATAGSDSVLLTMATTSRHSAATIAIACSPDAVGRVEGALGLIGGPQLPVRIVVLP